MLDMFMPTVNTHWLSITVRVSWGLSQWELTKDILAVDCETNGSTFLVYSSHLIITIREQQCSRNTVQFMGCKLVFVSALIPYPWEQNFAVSGNSQRNAELIAISLSKIKISSNLSPDFWTLKTDQTTDPTSSFQFIILFITVDQGNKTDLTCSLFCCQQQWFSLMPSNSENKGIAIILHQGLTTLINNEVKFDCS